MGTICCTPSHGVSWWTSPGARPACSP